MLLLLVLVGDKDMCNDIRHKQSLLVPGVRFTCECSVRTMGCVQSCLSPGMQCEKSTKLFLVITDRVTSNEHSWSHPLLVQDGLLPIGETASD